MTNMGQTQAPTGDGKSADTISGVVKGGDGESAAAEAPALEHTTSADMLDQPAEGDAFDVEVDESGAVYTMKFEEEEVVQPPKLALSQPAQQFDERRPFVFREAFPFKAVFPVLDATQWPDVNNTVTAIEEPPYGMEAAEFDVNAYNMRRGQATCYNYQPYIAGTAALLPMRSPEQIPLHERVSSFQQLFQVRPDVISMVHLENFKLEGPPRRQFIQQLAFFARAEVVVLRNMALTRVDDFQLPGVRYLDISYNGILEPIRVARLCARCPLLEHLVVNNNPLAQQPAWKHIILSGNPYMQTINGQECTMKDRFLAIDRYGSKEMKSRLGFLLWDWCICNASLQLGLPRWDPLAISKLTLSNVGLTEIHVGPFRALKLLDVSQNSISSMQHAGLEYCDALVSLDLGDNLLSTKEDLYTLSLVPSLQHVVLAGNRYEKYRQRVIYECINLRGTNRSLGLQSIDGEAIGLDEKIEAVRKYGGLSEIQLESLRWSYALIHMFGHFQLRAVPNFLHGIVKFCLPRAGLGVVDVTAFPNLVICDVSGNDLVAVHGFEHCTKLRYLDLSSNPKLKLDAVFKQLKNLSSLEHVLFIHDERAYENAAQQSTLDEYRIGVVAALMKSNRRLFAIDRLPITVLERTKALALRKGSRADCAAYAFNLAVFLSVAKDFSDFPSFHPDDVKPGKQFKAEEVVELRLGGLNFGNGDLDVSSFKNLERIDLSRNGLTETTSLGLERCPKLRVVDMIDNQIRASPEDLGTFFDKFPVLEILALRGNSCLTKSTERAKMLSCMKRMQQVDCSFRVLDSMITPTERMASWKASGLDDEKIDTMLWKTTIYQRSPRGVRPEQVVELDLSASDLKKVDLSPFANLQAVSLRGNNLMTWKNMGFESLRYLRILDLRDNQFRSADEACSVTKYLPSLQAFGASGNKFATSKTYREEVLRSIPSLKDVECRLQVLDEQEITIEELVTAWNNGGRAYRMKGDPEKFRFDALVFRKTPRGLTTGELTALDLSNARLSFVDFRSLNNLRKLSLRSNLLRNKHFASSYLQKCTQLEALDLGNNLLEDLRPVAALVDMSPKLKMVFVDGNPGYIAGGEKEIRRRIRFLTKLAQAGNLGASLRILNGRDISPHERCEAVRHLRSLHELEELRFKLMMEEKGPAAFSEILSLARCRLQLFTAIRSYTNIVSLDLSHNFLATVLHQGLRMLPKLHTLDLRRNLLDSFEETMQELSFCNELRVLYLQRAGREYGSNPDSYAIRVFERLRGLETLDDLQNPFPLTAQQRLAVQYLFSSFGVGRNNLHTVDLRNRNIKARQFWAILLALADLRSEIIEHQKDNLSRFIGPVIVHLREGNFNDAPISEYRFLMIFKIPTLEFLDELPVTLDERANAEKQMRPVLQGEKKEAGNGDRLTLLGLAASEALAAGMMASSTGDSSNAQTMNSLESAGHTTVDYAYIADHGDAMPALSDVKLGLAQSSVAIESTGSLLSKSEIVINFLQIFALLIGMNVPWPGQFFSIVWWTFMLNIDVESFVPSLSLTNQYVRYSCMMAAPLIFFAIYAVRFNRDRWWDAYVLHWTWTRWKYVFIWLGLVIVGGAIAIAVDTSYVSKIQNGNIVQFSSNGVGWSIFFGVAVGATAVMLLLLLNAINFRRHRSDQEYWMRVYNRYRQRIGLFFATVFYMPIARIALLTYKCTSNSSTLLLFSNMNCPPASTPSDYPPMFFVSGFFVLLYVIGIPLFFIYLISRGVKDVETNYGFGFDDTELKKMTELIKEDKKNKTLRLKLTQRRRAVRNKYANAVMNWRSASSYLFSAYERSSKFEKILEMSAKLSLLVIASFVGYGALQPLVAAGVLSFFFLLTLWRRPMADDLEDIMQLISLLTNVANAVIAYFLTSGGWPVNLDANLALIVINAINAGQLILNFFIYPIRLCIAARKKERVVQRVRSKSVSGSGEVDAGAVGSDVGAGAASVVEVAEQAADAAGVHVDVPVTDAAAEVGGDIGTGVGEAAVAVADGAAAAADGVATAASIAADGVPVAEAGASTGAAAGVDAVQMASEAAPELAQDIANADTAAEQGVNSVLASDEVQRVLGGAGDSSNTAHSQDGVFGSAITAESNVVADNAATLAAVGGLVMVAAGIGDDNRKLVKEDERWERKQRWKREKEAAAAAGAGAAAATGTSASGESGAGLSDDAQP